VAKKYKNEVAKGFIQEYMAKNPQREVMRVNVDKIKQKLDMDELFVKRIEEGKLSEEEVNLLVNGKKLPCLGCKQNTGWIKYTHCCGSPLHHHCSLEMKNCPVCGSKGFKL